jgi:hypothetical protein
MRFTLTTICLFVALAAFGQSMTSFSAQVDSTGRFFFITDTQAKTEKGVQVIKDISNPMTKDQLETQVRALDIELRQQLIVTNSKLLAIKPGGDPKEEIETRFADADLRRRIEEIYKILSGLQAINANVAARGK